MCLTLCLLSQNFSEVSYSHRLSSFFSQVGSIAGAVLIVIIAVVGGILYKGSWVITPKLWIIGTIFPAAGYCLGFFLARLAGLSWSRYRFLSDL